MRWVGVAVAFVVMGLAPVPSRAQGAPAAPAFETEPFSATDLLEGKRMTEADCGALPTAVWVTVEGRGECIRYYHAKSGGGGSDALVYFPIDVIVTNGRRERRPNAAYLKETPASMQNASVGWSRNLRMPYLVVARPGAYGSSGDHGKRRTTGEIDLVSAALDAIKARHGYARLHLIGYGEGGHLAAALLARRTDLGCVILASAFVSVRSRLAELGRSEDATGNKDPVDPLALVERVVKRPDLRIFVVTDPDDVVISARSQTIYARRLATAGLPVRQIFAAAPDSSAHALWRQAREIAAACAKGMPDDKIVATYQNKVPEVAPDADDPPLHRSDTLDRGIVVGEKECNSLATAVWVQVDGRGFCVRYWMSTAGGPKDEAMLYVHGDIGVNEPGKPRLSDHVARLTAAELQRDAHRWSRVYGGPYIAIGRVGAFGSSGHHLKERRTLLEVRVIMAALDALKERHGFKRFHAVGQSGGGHTVAALLQMRGDLGCAIMTSGSLSVKTLQRDLGRPLSAKVMASYDPVDHVKALQHRPGQRMIVMSDPDDRTVSLRSQREFVDRVIANGLPIIHVTAAAEDEKFHGLSSPGRRLASECAKGVDDGTLVTRYQNKAAPVARNQ